MADINRSRNAELDGLAEDDPLVELARIIGHDFQVGAERKAAAPADREADLEMDLESELLGELSAWNEESAAANEGAPVRPVEKAPDTAAEETANDPVSELDIVSELEAAFGEDESFVAPSSDTYLPEQAEPAASSEAAAFSVSSLEMEGRMPSPETQDKDESVSPVEQALPAAADTDADPDEAASAVADLTETEPEASEGGEPSLRIATIEGEEGATAEASSHGALAEESCDSSREAAEVAMDEISSDDVGEHFPSLYASNQPETEAETDTTPEVVPEEVASSEEAREPFDYSRAAVDRHEFLADPLDEGREAVADSTEEGQSPTVVDAERSIGQMRQEADAATVDAFEVPEPVVGHDDPDETGQDDAFNILDGSDVHGLTPATDTVAASQFTENTESAAQGTLETAYDEEAAAAPADDPSGQPLIDIVDIPEDAAALPDDLDIPEVKEEPQVLGAAEFDDLEAQLAGAFGSLASEIEDEQDTNEDDEYEAAPAATAAAAVTTAAAAATAYSYRAEPSHETFSPRPEDTVAGYGHPGDPGFGEEYTGTVSTESADFYYDPTAGEEMATVGETEEADGSRRRGLLVAGLVAAIAVAGGIGAFTLSSGEKDAVTPAIVKADDGPIKIKPEDPGGPKVPNQDSEVYQRVAGENVVAPTQERLISSTEEPVDLTMPTEPRSSVAEETASATGKSEARLTPTPEESDADTIDEIVALQPRRVKTVVVRPDGTIVPNEETAAEPESRSNDQSAALGAEETADPDSSAPASDDADDALAELKPVSVPSASSQAQNSAAKGDPDATAAKADSTADEAAETAPTPAARPTVPAHEPEAPQVASGEPAGQAARSAADTAVRPSSEWSVQIASQPTVEGAQQSYQNLAQRYGDLLSGRGVNIVRAEIEGKGTYYRVRIPSTSKEDAIDLCSKLKAAGGSCFVSK